MLLNFQAMNYFVSLPTEFCVITGDLIGLTNLKLLHLSAILTSRDKAFITTATIERHHILPIKNVIAEPNMFVCFITFINFRIFEHYVRKISSYL